MEAEMTPVVTTCSPRAVVLMPTYRQAAFIARAIRSLFDQTFLDWELLIINDGSPDETVDRIAPFLCDSRVRVIRLRHNRGLGAALNSGLDHTDSELIAYLPSDDVFHRNHLDEL